MDADLGVVLRERIDTDPEMGAIFLHQGLGDGILEYIFCRQKSMSRSCNESYYEVHKK